MDVCRRVELQAAASLQFECNTAVRTKLNFRFHVGLHGMVLITLKVEICGAQEPTPNQLRQNWNSLDAGSRTSTEHG